MPISNRCLSPWPRLPAKRWRTSVNSTNSGDALHCAWIERCVCAAFFGKGSEKKVLLDCEPVEDRGDLKHQTHPHPGPACHRQGRDVRFTKTD